MIYNTENKTIMHLPDQVIFVLSQLEAAGYHAYAVGGCVRDHLMSRIPGDYDVTTSAKPEEMLEVFSDCRVVETGLKHGTVTVVKDGMNIETTTYRIDGTYDDGRHPDSVTFTDKLSDDLMRRDFTINAMAYSPERGIVDLWGGRDDLDAGVIRCVGCARDRFSEDGLRILRALRFASVLGFTLEGECDEAVRALTPLLEKISRERIYAELTKLICGKGAREILSSYPEVISYVLPELSAENVTAAAEYIGRIGTDGGADLRYSLLFSDIPYGSAQDAVNSLKTSRDEKSAILGLLKHRGALTETSDYAIKKLISRTDDVFPRRLAMFLLTRGEITSNETEEIIRLTDGIVSRGECRSLPMLAVNGCDLGALGYSGREIGEKLAHLLDSVMLGTLTNDREALLEKCRK